MTTKLADRLIASGQSFVLVDRYGDHGVFEIASRDRLAIQTKSGSVFSRSDIAEVHPL